MEIFSLQFFIALANIVFVDLLLAGDNAIVIGMAARNLDPQQQKKAIILGTGGAVLIRIVATIIVVKLLQIPWLLLIGGLLLLWIAFKLLVDHKEDDEHVKAGSSLMAAVWTIILADAAMGLDNVIAVAGAAQGHTLLVTIGLLISVPIVVWGSTIFIKVIERYPWIIYAGSAVLAFNAAKMITEEAKIHHYFVESPVLKWTFIVVIVALVIGGGKLVKGLQHKRQEQNA
ncbi:hypothetical protein BVG16_11185 [Paenibacillus selenitireducens]|uniref:Tellurium resistance protein TerC n=1 Tax=Paenibacillus selenitireducens TaxID=1324314 RepID=A0A1T2XFU5_9BACL|nr:TerC family protein [Paenibacillus selenitireducens]OPA78767.1 hypothetical protein BVG16_11185 [Paenibacillus selenitireducens]